MKVLNLKDSESVKATIKQAWTDICKQFDEYDDNELFSFLLGTWAGDFDFSEVGTTLIRLKVLCLLGRRLGLNPGDRPGVLQELEEKVDADAISIPSDWADNIAAGLANQKGGVN